MHNHISLTYSETYTNCTERLSTVQYEGDHVTFVTNKIIKNENLIIRQNECQPQKQPNMGDKLKN